MTDQTTTSEQTTTTDTAAAAAATSATATAADTGQQAAAAWYEGLPDDIKGNPSVQKYATAEEAARGLISYSGLFGVPDNQLLRLPKPDDVEGNAALWNKLGRPESVDQYGIKVEGEGAVIDQPAVDAFLAHMHKAGPFTPQMAKEAMTWYEGFAKQQLEGFKAERTQAVETATTTLKAEWGEKYADKLKGAVQAATDLGGQELMGYLDETGLGSDPRFIKMMAAVADKLAEPGTMAGAGAAKPGGALTPAEASAELAKFDTDPNIIKALNDANHPQHQHFLDRRLALFAARRATA